MKHLLLIIILLHLSHSPVLAHPGRTAADGCHYCRTNCASWGVAQDERHCHNGSPAPVVTASPTRVVTPAPTSVYIPIPTKVKTPTPTKKITPTPTKVVTPTIKPSTTPTPTVNTQVATVTPKSVGTTTRTSSDGFWSWLLKLFGVK